MLVVHGDADNVVALELGQKLFERALAPKRFERVAGGSHHNTNQIGMAQYRTALNELFGLKGLAARQLAGAPAAPSPR